MRKIKTICSALVLALSVMSCSGGDDSPSDTTAPPTGGGTTVTNPTYSANIKAIIDGNCVSCHGPGGENSDHPLQTYEQVSARASDIKERIGKPVGDPLKMPKGGSLSQANIDLINKWIANGMPN
ncbi:c-type cytochrome [Flavobacterium aestivum]|uniref:c-type cytochrome n=1 Tax=Flavobacterium aestivum TaxID=3003257 RepID=UPI002286BE3A|nr:cytochrome c [Flavobacterium aestivum]